MDLGKLYVPIKIDCLLVNEKNRNYASITPHYDKDGIVLGDIIAGDDIFKPGSSLDKGAHIHWHLPEGLVRGIPKEEGSNRNHETPNQGRKEIQYHEVPNRWLVARYCFNKKKQGSYFKAWVIESDYIYKERTKKEDFVTIPFLEKEKPESILSFRYLGRKCDFENWNEGVIPKLNETAGYLDKLTAIGPGDPFFSKYYPNCRNVFGMHDDLSDFDADTEDLAYVVIGWYSRPEDGPLFGCNDEEAWKARMIDLKWKIDDKYNPPYPTDILCTGVIYNIPFGRTEDCGSEGSSGEIKIAVGNNSMEALSALIQSKKKGQPEISRLLDALQNSLLSNVESSPDGIAELEIGNYQRAFTPVFGGIRWVIAHAEPGEEVSPPQMGDKFANLNKTLNKYKQLKKGETYGKGEMLVELNNLLNEYKQLEGELTSVPGETLGEMLANLNALQNEYEHLGRKQTADKWGLYSTWYKYIYRRDVENFKSNDGNIVDKFIQVFEKNKKNLENNKNALKLQIEKIIERINIKIRIDDTERLIKIIREKGTIEEVKMQIDMPSDSFNCKLDAIDGSRFWQPNELALMISGLNSSYEDHNETSNEDLLLKCQILKHGLYPYKNRFILEYFKNKDIPLETSDLLDNIWYFLDSVHGSKVTTRKYEWRAPLTPLFLLWEAELYTLTKPSVIEGKLNNWVLDDIDFGWLTEKPIGEAIESKSAKYKGITILTPHAFLNLKDKCPQLREEIESLNVLSNLMGGFNEALIMRKQTLQFPIFDRPEDKGGNPKLASKVKKLVEDMNHLSPLIDPITDPTTKHNFNPIREGFLKISRIWIVDSFGRIQELDVKPKEDEEQEKIIIAESLRTPEMEALEKNKYITLPPRIIQPSRLAFRWISASKKEWIESSLASDTSPIFGWIMPNHLDFSLMIYNSSGGVLGSLQCVSSKNENKVKFRTPQGVVCESASNLDQVFQNKDFKGSSLIGFLKGIMEQGAGAFYSLMEHIDETLQGVEALGSKRDQNLSVLIGRPLALVRALLKLELYGPPVCDQILESLGKPYTRNFEKVKFPVRLGDPNQLKDGLVGYFLEDKEKAYSTFYSTYSAGMESRSAYVMHDHQIELTCNPEDKPVLLTLIMDPRGGVHINSGILPTKFIELPHHYLFEALSKMEVSFLTSPLIVSLTDDGVIDIPLPSVSSGDWSFAYQEKSDQESQGNWKELKAVSKGLNSILTLGDKNIIEGWLKLKGMKEETKE